jgi:hypothetical protein
MSSEQPSMIEDGGYPLVRGAGLGCALAGFGLLIAAQLLPWISMTTTPLQQDFPTSTGGRLERGLDELPIGTEIFNLGWLVVLGAVATALAVRPAVRRVVVATGLGLVGGQLALLAGMTRAVSHNGLFRGTLTQPDLPIHLEAGLYAAYLALALFALALLFASGVAARWPGRSSGAADGAAAGEAGPADLTVTPLPTPDPTVWSRTDIEVGGARPER